MIVIADSCYSGTVFRGNKSLQTGGEQKKQFLQRIIKKKTRVALTSGGNEPVVDAVGGGSHSVFAQSLIDILKENDDVMTSTTLSEKVKKYVIPRIKAYQIDQTPEHSNMYKAGHDGGGFCICPESSRHSIACGYCNRYSQRIICIAIFYNSTYLRVSSHTLARCSTSLQLPGNCEFGGIKLL